MQWLVGMVLFTAAHLDGETATASARQTTPAQDGSTWALGHHASSPLVARAHREKLDLDVAWVHPHAASNSRGPDAQTLRHL